MNQIHILEDQLINKIAAGEVVERPASIVKELVENAIDAKSTHVDIALEDGGCKSIIVTDDGSGVAKGDMPLTLQRHATSKIANIDDLFGVLTMGFRGEALASISAVAQVEMKTRERGAEMGSKVVLSGSDSGDLEEVACSEGTQFAVKNLFFKYSTICLFYFYSILMSV